MSRSKKPFDHNRLLKSVAAELLEPLGLYQLGRSRIWVDDHTWWVIVVAFGPSGFGRGTYLNVGVSLAWKPDQDAGLAFDTDIKSQWKTPMGNFESQFVEARRPDWFERDVRAFAEGAIGHLGAIRARPNDLRSFVARLDGSPHFWDRYHRGVGRGLLRDASGAARDFATVVGEPNPYEAEWIRDTQENARTLSGLLATPTAFEAQIAAQVVRFRKGARLRDRPEDDVVASLRAAA